MRIKNNYYINILQNMSSGTLELINITVYSILIYSYLTKKLLFKIEYQL